MTDLAATRWRATSSPERVLGLPREYAADRGVPFNQVRHNRL